MLKAWNWQVTGRVDEPAGDASEAILRASVAYRPAVFRALAKDWPLVRAAGEGADAAFRHLLQYARGVPAKTMVGPPEINGRFFYNDEVKGYNFAVDAVPFETIFAQLLALETKDNAPAIYAGSNLVNEFLPGFDASNRLPLDILDAAARIWIGNATHVAPHFDVSDNIAIVALGNRRVTLFPPEQTANLYVGPLDVTIAGQPVSMVDIRSPDLDRFPLFSEAMKHAIQVDLGPGDAIYVPTLWWHCIEALDPVNILVNYWYDAPQNSSPFAAMIHAMLAVRDLPDAQRSAWQSWFDHFVFGKEAALSADHLPSHAKGVSGPPSRERAEAVRSYVMRALG